VGKWARFWQKAKREFKGGGLKPAGLTGRSEKSSKLEVCRGEGTLLEVEENEKRSVGEHTPRVIWFMGGGRGGMGQGSLKHLEKPQITYHVVRPIYCLRAGVTERRRSPV